MFKLTQEQKHDLGELIYQSIEFGSPTDPHTLGKVFKEIFQDDVYVEGNLTLDTLWRVFRANSQNDDTLYGRRATMSIRMADKKTTVVLTVYPELLIDTHSGEFVLIGYEVISLVISAMLMAWKASQKT